MIWPYLGVIAVRFKMLLQYRAAALAGFVTQLFWGAIRLMVFGAFYSAAVSAADVPMTFAQIVVYVWLGQALLALLPWNVDQEIAQCIRSGDVAYELLRPLHLYWFWFARTLAFRAAGTSLRMIPMLGVAFFVLPVVGLNEWALPLPASWQSGALFVVSLLPVLLLSTAITMVMHISLIWTLSGEGFNRLMPGIVSVFSGLIVPLPLYPEWIQPLMFWQPFRGLADVPFRIYSGSIAVGDAGLELLMQWSWVAVITAFGMLLLGRARYKLVVQGG